MDTLNVSLFEHSRDFKTYSQVFHNPIHFRRLGLIFVVRLLLRLLWNLAWVGIALLQQLPEMLDFRPVRRHPFHVARYGAHVKGVRFRVQLYKVALFQAHHLKLALNLSHVMLRHVLALHFTRQWAFHFHCTSTEGHSVWTCPKNRSWLV